MSGLEVSSLSVWLADRSVLEDVNLKVEPGELIGLVGPNGAGKTTLLRTILGLLPPEAGRILIDGLPPTAQRGRIGYVPQRHEFAWDFPVTVREAVMTGRTRAIGWLCRPGAADREAVEEALERAGISDLGGRPLGELSGGQRQRVLVARALALRPSLLLLDEPFTAVDAPTQQTLTELLIRLRAEGTILLMTTHDLVAAGRICTRVALLNRTIVAEGPPELLRDPTIWMRAFGIDNLEHSSISLAPTL
jgi:manganese/iron transport system ATP-binding protein